jgi:hypothetical protein
MPSLSAWDVCQKVVWCMKGRWITELGEACVLAQPLDSLVIAA